MKNNHCDCKDARNVLLFMTFLVLILVCVGKDDRRGFIYDLALAVGVIIFPLYTILRRISMHKNKKPTKNVDRLL